MIGKSGTEEPAFWPQTGVAPGIGFWRWPSAAARGLACWFGAEQGRWALWLPVAFAAGIALYFALYDEPSWPLVIAAALSGCVLRLLGGRPLIALLVTSALCAAGLGLLAAKLRSARVAAPVITKPSRALKIEGWVVRWERRAGARDRVTLRPYRIDGMAAQHLPRLVRITISGVPLPVGTPVSVLAKLLPPPEPAEPGAFDFARAAYFKGLGAVGYALSKAKPAITDPASDSGRRAEKGENLTYPPLPLPLELKLSAALSRLRMAINARITAALGDIEAGIAKALITGERSGVPEEVREHLRRAGLAHILAISGLHMAIFAGSLFWLVRAGLSLIPVLALRYSLKKWAAVAALLGGGVYLVLSGSAVATERAFIMAAVMFAAIVLDRPALSLRNVMLAGLIILAVRPESLLDVSFQMSFAATIALIGVYEALRQAPRRRAAAIGPAPLSPARSPAGTQERRGGFAWLRVYLGGLALTTAIAGTAVAPFAAYHFHQIAPFSLIGNLLAMPIVAGLILPAALLSLIAMPFGLEALALKAMGLGIDLVLTIASWVAAWPGAARPVATFPLAALALLVLGGLWLAIWSRRWRLLGLLPIAAGLALTGAGERADIFIARDGRVIAARDGSGTLVAIPGRAGNFSLSAWLEADGDARLPKQARHGRLFRCDQSSCVAMVGPPGDAAGPKLRLSYTKTAAALAEDCRMADILITPLSLDQDCAGPRLVIDAQTLRREGAQTISLRTGAGAPQLIRQSVSAWRGHRPWVADRTRHTPR